MMTKATDFEKEMDRLKSLIKQSKELDAAIKAVELSDAWSGGEDTSKKYRLPYSSNPKPIGEPWRY